MLAAFRDFRELGFIGPSLAHLAAFAVPMWLVSGSALLTGLNTKQSKVHGLHRIDLRQILGGVLRLRRGYGLRA